jgi:hypothetical protein
MTFSEGRFIQNVNQQSAYSVDWLTAGLELDDCGADLDDTTDNLMSGNAWIDSGHHAPLGTDGVEVRVAYTADKDFNLNVVLARITLRDRYGIKRRFRIRSSISLALY